jgi:hypothetical protein
MFFGLRAGWKMEETTSLGTDITGKVVFRMVGMEAATLLSNGGYIITPRL